MARRPDERALSVEPAAAPTRPVRRRRGRRLPRSFYDRDPLLVAPELLGKLIVRVEDDGTETIARIVEVEAYRGLDDPASHAFRGPTPRVTTMFGPPGHLYVYFTYGMHWCANVVCGPGLAAGAVLLRAGQPVAGVDQMWARRPKARTDRQLTAGPARLAQALGLDRRHDGVDLVDPRGPVVLRDDGTRPPSAPHISNRIGIRVATDRPWRWSDPSSPYVS
jgi:DNA-3-methyladenine glycosylase